MKIINATSVTMATSRRGACGFTSPETLDHVWNIHRVRNSVWLSVIKGLQLLGGNNMSKQAADYRSLVVFRSTVCSFKPYSDTVAGLGL